MNKKLDTLELANEMRGFGTVKSIQNRLNISRARAIYLLYRLRKDGFVQTTYQSNKSRVYHISPRNAIGGISYDDIINEYTPEKLLSNEVYLIHDRIPSIEETLIYAISQKTVRYIIACLGLFRKIKNWSELYKRAKKHNLVREVAALYDIARLYLPKLGKMPKRFKTLAVPAKKDKYKYIIYGFDSDDFKEIEKKWKIYIPLNTADLEEYTGVYT